MYLHIDVDNLPLELSAFIIENWKKKLWDCYVYTLKLIYDVEAAVNEKKKTYLLLYKVSGYFFHWMFHFCNKLVSRLYQFVIYKYPLSYLHGNESIRQQFHQLLWDRAHEEWHIHSWNIIYYLWLLCVLLRYGPHIWPDLG